MRGGAGGGGKNSGPRPPRGPPSPGTRPSRQEKLINPTEDQLCEIENLVENKCCGEYITKELEHDCQECGPGLRTTDIEYSIIGNDVKALYPSITAENTGRIVRTRAERTNLEFEGFDTRIGLAYLAMNKKLTTGLSKV